MFKKLMYIMYIGLSFILIYSISFRIKIIEVIKEVNAIFLNGWKPRYSQIYKEFIDALNETELIKYSKSYSMVRDIETKKILHQYRFKYIDVIDNFDEFNVLEKMINFCNEDENYDDYVLYIHFKGSYHDNRENSELRKMLIHYVIRNYNKCIVKLKNGADVCGARYSLLPYRHYSGNMWWSKCKYIKTLKPVKYTVLGKRYSVGFNGYNGDRYSAEKWIMSNSQSIPSDLMSDDIEFAYNYGSEYLYKIWIKDPQNIQFSPNFNILYSTVKFNKEMNFYPHTYYALFFNLLYDYEVYFDLNQTNLFNFGWCKGLLHSELTNENNKEKESIGMVNSLIEYCKIAKGLKANDLNHSNIQLYKTADKDIVYLSNIKCNDEYFKSKFNDFDIICSEKNDVNYDYQVIYEICRNESFNKNIYYSNNYDNIMNLRLKCDKSKDFCGKWHIHPFRGSEIGWKASCKFIRNAGKPKYYKYEGKDLEKNDEYYGLNKYSYLHYPLVNPFQNGNCDELNKSSSNVEILHSVLLNAVFDIKIGLITKEYIHKCYWWCNCFSFDKSNKVNENLFYFCNICNK